MLVLIWLFIFGINHDVQHYSLKDCFQKAVVSKKPLVGVNPGNRHHCVREEVGGLQVGH